MIYSTTLLQSDLTKELMTLIHTLEHFPKPILIASTKGKIVFVNSAWVNCTGYCQNEVAGKNPNILKSGKTSQEVYKQMWNALHNNKTFASDEVINKRKDGSEYQIQTTIFPIRHNDATKFYVQMSEDITHRKKLDYLKREFLSAAAHELKTPITTLKLLIESGLRKRADKDEITVPVAAFKLVEKELNRLTRLINDLSDVSRLETGKFNLQIDVIDIVALIQESIEQMKTVSKGHVFVFTSCKPIAVLGDGGRVKQVIINLINNAIKYSAPNTSIELSIEQDNESVTVAVKDYGVGIPAEHRIHIFDRFYQIEENMKSGLGLGLHISKQIITQHGGRIWVESQHGKGSTFFFTLKKYK